MTEGRARRYAEASPGPRPFVINRISSLNAGSPMRPEDETPRNTNQSPSQTSLESRNSSSVKSIKNTPSKSVMTREDVFDDLEAELLRDHVLSSLADSGGSSSQSLPTSPTSDPPYDQTTFSRSFPGHTNHRDPYLSPSVELIIRHIGRAQTTKPDNSIGSGSIADLGSVYSSDPALRDSVKGAARFSSLSSSVGWRSVRLTDLWEHDRLLL